MKWVVLGLLFLTGESHATLRDSSVGVYFAGGSTFQFILGTADWVNQRIAGRQLAHSYPGGCCAGGTSGYFGGGQFNVGTACELTRGQAAESAASACESRAPYIRCDYSMQVQCAR
ncbi:hypothetical protein K2X33_00760 [bacterium]|nr:hypothetical protein [bacterium]